MKIQPHYRTLSGKISVSVHRLWISSVPTANLCHSAEKISGAQHNNETSGLQNTTGAGCRYT
ncbi:hypothetical protein CBX33_05300 [Salmonella enterica]|nr:hypothetical protein [Salmonella enterica]